MLRLFLPYSVHERNSSKRKRRANRFRSVIRTGADALRRDRHATQKFLLLCCQFSFKKKKKGRHRRGAGSNHHCAGSWKATAKKRKAIGLDLSDTTRITSQLQIHCAPPPPQPRNVIKRGDRKSSTDKGRRGDANSQPESISIDWAPKEERDVTGRENIIHFLDATTPFLLSIHLCPVIKSRKKKEERKWPSLSLYRFHYSRLLSLKVTSFQIV